jgi:hypothetical protein
MTAANPVIYGDRTSKEAAILSAVYEAVSWRHTLENGIEGQRKGQRVVIYPKELTGLSQVITTRNVVVQDDVEDHAELYAGILKKCDEFENPPIFMTEDCDQLIANPAWSSKIGEWMAIAARAATGGQRRVLEDGPDVMRSDDEDSKVEEHGEELHDCFVGCASLADLRLTEQQAQELRGFSAFSSAITYQPTESSQSSPPLPEYPSPDSEQKATTTKSDEESVAPRSDSPVEDWMNPKERRFAEVAARSLAKNPVIPRPVTRTSDSEIQPPAKATPVKIVKASAVSAADLPEGLKKAVISKTKAAASPRVSADQETGAKAPTRKKGQESPGTQVPPPMETRARKKASGAGGLRGVDGLGQTEIGVDHIGPPSKT